MVARFLSRDAVVGAEVQHAVQKVIAVCAESLPSTEQGWALRELFTQPVVGAVRELQLQEHPQR